jgi:hypothetical protein
MELPEGIERQLAALIGATSRLPLQAEAEPMAPVECES